MLWAQLPSLVVSVGNADLSRTCSAEQPMQPMPPRSDNFTRRFRRVCSIRSNFTTLIHLWTRVTFSPGGFPLNITIKLTRRSSKHPLSDPWTTAAPADRGRRRSSIGPKLRPARLQVALRAGGKSWIPRNPTQMRLTRMPCITCLKPRRPRPVVIVAFLGPAMRHLIVVVAFRTGGVLYRRSHASEKGRTRATSDRMTTRAASSP